MCKFLMIVTLTVLALAGSAQGFVGRCHYFGVGIDRTQDFEITSPNRIEWGGGVGSAHGERRITITQRQDFGNGHGLSVLQKERGRLVQTATASGETGSATVEQKAKINGSQHLSIDSRQGSRASQTLGVKLNSLVTRPNGVGTVNGTQRFTGAQEQMTATPYGTGTQSQRVNIVQSSSINTGTDTDPTVTNNISVTLNQSQSTGGR
jgi:hypothetical protein